MKKHRRGLMLLVAVLFLAAAFVYVLLTNPEWRRFDVSEFFESLRHVRVSYLLLAMGAIFSTYSVRALRWKLLLLPVRPDASFLRIFSATIIGFGAMGVLGRAGEVVRVYLIARGERTPLTSQLAIWVLERAFDTLVVLAGLVFAIGWIAGTDSPAGQFISTEIQRSSRWVGAAVVLILVLLVALRRYYDALADRFLNRAHHVFHAKTLGSLERGMRLFGEGLHGLRDLKTVVAAIGLTVFHWLLVVVTCYGILMAALPALHWGVSETVIFTGVVMLGSLVQLPAVGGGVQVSAALVLTEFFGAPVEGATAAALLAWLVSFMAVILPALLLMARDGLQWANLSELESKA